MASQNPSLQGLFVAILVTDGFEQVEMTAPRDALWQQGCETRIISHALGKVQGYHHLDKAELFDVDLSFAEADPKDFDAVLLPGGVVNADQLRVNPEAQRFVRDMDHDGKLVFVICHGGWLLVSAGLVDGRIMTSWPSLRDDIVNAGGDWIDKDVVVDGNWVSSRQPDDIPQFNKRLIEQLEQQAGILHASHGDQPGMGLAD